MSNINTSSSTTSSAALSNTISTNGALDNKDSKNRSTKDNQSILSNLTLIKLSPFLGITFYLSLFWIIPSPVGLSAQAWHLFGIFSATIIGIITNVFPMGTLAILALSLGTLTQTVTLKQALSGFSSHIVWLIVFAFLLARGFIKTGLGSRIAYYFVMVMGKSTLGLGYGIVTSEFLLAPFTPSNTARGAGIIYPIISSISKEYGSSPEQNTQRKIGGFLMKLSYQANVITSAMFLTATAGNPLIVSLASKLGFELNWTTWALSALLPGIACLAVLPFVIYYLYPPEIKRTDEAPQFARKKLAEMGPLKTSEWIMLGTFSLLLVLWVFGAELGIDAAVAAMVGLAILLLTGVLTCDDIFKEQNAWHTYLWLTTLLMMSTFLTEFGFMSWFSEHIKGMISSFHWITALSIIILVYYYSHYAFASMVSHISALFSPFALVAIATGAPPALTILFLAFTSSLCAGITHYGTGTAPVYFGSEYVSIKDWWRVGGIVSIVNLTIWGVVGYLWWSILGLI